MGRRSVPGMLMRFIVYIEAHNIPAIVGENDHYVEEPKRRCDDDEHIDCGNSRALIS